MSDQLTEVAESFIRFVSDRKSELHNLKEITEPEIQVLMQVLTAAGFSPIQIALGVLQDYNRDQDGSALDLYSINTVSPFVIISEYGNDKWATGWFDNLFTLVLSGGYSYNKTPLSEQVVEEIEKSRPLEPVQLTPDGDYLLEYPPSELFTAFPYFVDHTRDQNTLSACVGIHQHCHGWVDRRRATSTHDAISCRACGLRVLFPKEVKTYGELRAALAAKFAQISL